MIYFVSSGRPVRCALFTDHIYIREYKVIQPNLELYLNKCRVLPNDGGHDFSSKEDTQRGSSL